MDAAAAIDIMAGVEGSGQPKGLRRSRTTLRAGVDGWLDAHPDSILAAGVLVEVEPSAAFGAELRYRHRVVEELLLDLGPTAIFVPETMLGAFAGISYRPRLSQRIELDLGARGGAYFVGSDLPSGTRALGQGLLSAGIRVEM